MKSFEESLIHASNISERDKAILRHLGFKLVEFSRLYLTFSLSKEPNNRNSIYLYTENGEDLTGRWFFWGTFKDYSSLITCLKNQGDWVGLTNLEIQCAIAKVKEEPK